MKATWTWSMAKKYCRIDKRPGPLLHRLIHNRSYSAQSYIKTERLCSTKVHPYTSIHTHTLPFNGPFSGTTQVSRYQKGKTNLDFTEARDSEWQWHQLTICKSAPRSRQITTPAPHHSSFLQAGCPSCRPTNSVKALKALIPLNELIDWIKVLLPILLLGEQRHDGCEQFA